MRKPLSRRKRQALEDINEVALRVRQEATGEVRAEEQSEKNPAAVALGRLGGVRGGPARAKKLSAKRRSEIARKAARERWRRRG